MLGNFWQAFCGRFWPRDRCVPASAKLPRLWSKGSGNRYQANLAVLSDAPTEALTELCDSYWNSFLGDCETAEGGRLFRDRTVHQRALALLAERGPKVISWARARLRHLGYDARRDAAELLGQLAKRGQLGRDRNAVAQDLAALATRAWQEDTKEVEANAAALSSLAIIGGPTCLATIRHILMSTEWDDDDLQWDAAQVLAEITGTGIAAAEDPIAAARDWLRAHPGELS